MMSWLGTIIKLALATRELQNLINWRFHLNQK